ncbi:MAG: GNAT family N-acetyltransferase [Xanthomonadales bacterium]|nr:GNAT family N-acetyltransferase [Xanthomonadales bacterium]
MPSVRLATRDDIPELMRIRAAVRENRLVSRVIGAEEIRHEIEVSGRGWVVDAPTPAREDQPGKPTLGGFAIGNRDTGNIWALFVDPICEGCGIGRSLHDVMIGWLFDQGLTRLHLSTEAGTRAESFYRRAGWTETGRNAHGEIEFEMLRPAGR